MKRKKIIITQQEEVIFEVAIILNMKVIVIEIKKLSVEEYLNKIKPYLIINNLKKPDIWKSQLTIANSFIFS